MIWTDQFNPEYPLEFLLAFDGRIHHLEEGYWIKFEIKRVKSSDTSVRMAYLILSLCTHPRASGSSVSTTPIGVAATGSRYKTRPRTRDHRHRTESDSGRPYRFVNVETLHRGCLTISFPRSNEPRLQERGVGTTVIAVEEKDS